MLHRSPNLPLSVVCLLALVFAQLANAQSPDGFTVQERAGIALIKPQSWSKDSQAIVMEFEAFTDRTARGAGIAGYIEFRTRANPKRQIPSGRIVKMVIYPEPNLVREIITDSDRTSLATVVDDIESTVKKFPATRTYVKPAVDKLNEEIALYDSGKVKVAGKWIDRTTFVAQKARTYSGQIRPDIVSANPPSSFDLQNDPRYIALVELAKTSPNVKPLIADLTNLHGKLVGTEKRKELLAQLAQPNLDFKSASAAVAELKTLKPDEDPQSALFVKKWDAAVVEVDAAKAEAKPLAIALETEMKAVKDATLPPNLSPDLDSKINHLSGKMSTLVASKPPGPLLVEARQAIAVCAIQSGFPKLQTSFEQHRFLQAKDELDNLSFQSRQIGPETSRVVADLQQTAASAIAEFSRFSEEGKVQLDANKPAEALAAYEKAYEAIADPATADTIAKLKEQVEKDAAPQN